MTRTNACVIGNLKKILSDADISSIMDAQHGDGTARMIDYHCFKNIEALFADEQRHEGQRLLMELQSRCIALHDAMDSLKTQVREYEDIVFLSKSLHFGRPFYWLHLDSLRHGPFCPVCYEGDKSLLRLTRHKDSWLCPRCHAHIHDADRQHAPQPRSHTPLKTAQARQIPFGRCV